MADTLTKIKKSLNIDQRNLLVATVISDHGATLSLRSTRGEALIAGNPGGSYRVGDRVEVSTNGTTYTVTGLALVVELAGEKVVLI
ncbi:hypothetical protein [Geopsychrobacter electrodiphilus]|uniref:hypothetical protein n=1 Tax=Geopsychrobacter electrodiphilus TaxID=225196 RepID=UPI00036EB4B7|nr:hypothetical protein [Geopsychrobacter electrodiphilus]